MKRLLRTHHGRSRRKPSGQSRTRDESDDELENLGHKSPSKGRPESPIDPQFENVGRLQSTIGNQELQQQFSEARSGLKAEDSHYEREADRFARSVISDSVSKKLVEQKAISRLRGHDTKNGLGLRSQIETRRIQDELSAGRQLPSNTRSFFESRFGRDFRGVQIHTGSKAAALAERLDARAFTVGQDIAFANGEFAPDTLQGRSLMAHELTHVVQQGGTGSRRQSSIQSPALQRQTGAIVDYMGPIRALMNHIRPEVHVEATPPDRRPPPDHGKTESQLGAWEHAELHTSPTVNLDLAETTDPNGRTVSYVTNVSIRFNPHYEHRIAKKFYSNQQRGKPGATTWRQVYNLIREHSVEHFVRYDEVLRQIKIDLEAELRQLPSGIDPVLVSKTTLRDYVGKLLKHFNDRLNHEAWKTTCDWEKQDYPRLSKRVNSIPSVYLGKLTPQCGSPPQIAQKPSLIKGRPGSGGSNPAPTAPNAPGAGSRGSRTSGGANQSPPSGDTPE